MIEPRLAHLEHRLRQRLRLKVRSAIERCTDPGHRAYAGYGGRGISVHREWLDDPVAFVLHLAGLPGCDVDGLFLDRADNERGYEPGNLRFVSPSVSACNSRPYYRNRDRKELANGIPA